jgi:fructosamine-3-kinase
MQQLVQDTILQYYKEIPHNITPLGGGFYGRVFLAEIKNKSFKIAVKIYLRKNMAAKEALQLTTLSKYSLLKIPEVYHVLEKINDTEHDLVLMEFIEGVNAGNITLSLSEESRINIANQIIDNLLTFHTAVNPQGFGKIDAEYYTADWNTLYWKEAKKIIHKAEELFSMNKLHDTIYQTMKKAFSNYEKIFYLPITTARLIHGDYNTWNILLNNEQTKVNAVFDPLHCCWADSEYDLFNLNQANGKYFGLFNLYKSKTPLSENHEIKMIFYELFNKIMHYFDASIDIQSRQKYLIEMANQLNNKMKMVGIK